VNRRAAEAASEALYNQFRPPDGIPYAQLQPDVKILWLERAKATVLAYLVARDPVTQ
jgi:hypothetical protein